MSACIALRDDYDGLQLRELAKASRDPRQVRRLLALANSRSRAPRRHEPAGETDLTPETCSRPNVRLGLFERRLDSHFKCNT